MYMYCWHLATSHHCPYQIVSQRLLNVLVMCLESLAGAQFSGMESGHIHKLCCYFVSQMPSLFYQSVCQSATVIMKTYFIAQLSQQIVDSIIVM